MLKRLSRLAGRTFIVYLGEKSKRAAAGYLLKALFLRFSFYIRRAFAFFIFLRFSRPASQSQRLTMIRAEGKIAVGVMVGGGVGDMIVIARCLRDLAANVEPFSFDVFAPQPDLARWIFAAIPNFGEAHPDLLEGIAGREYDIWLRCHQLLIVHWETARWAQLRKVPRLAAVLSKIERSRQRDGLDPYIQYHPRLDNGLARKAVYANRSRIDYLHAIAGLSYGGHALPLAADDTALVRHGLAGRDFVTIHNGFDANFSIASRRATKCYPHFAEVIALIKAKQPDIFIVQIGTTTSEPIPGVDLDLINQTSLREVAGLLRETKLHIDNEGGLVHLAACYGRRSLVVFGPTPSDYFGYKENINIDPVRCGGCWWIDEFWMERCPRGMAQSECMFAQPPERIAAEALAALQPNLASTLRRVAVVGESAESAAQRASG